jgi:hypothetical protein
MPYSELELSPGKYNLRMDIDLIKNEGGLIQHLAFHEFEYEKSGEANQTPATQKPSAKLDRIWIDYDVVEDGRKGMRVHAKFTVNNLKGVDSYLAAYFEKRDGTALKTTNTTYASKTGQVAVYRSMKPGYEPTDYSDLSVFMPYDELNLSSGSYDLRVDLDVIYKAGELIQHLDYYNFTYRSGS